MLWFLHVGYTYISLLLPLLLVKTYGFKDGTNTGNDYTYDKNGNMISDANKGISAITYNYLNLPIKVSFGTNRFIDYIYDASGVKQQKVVTEGSSLTTTQYAGNYIYENNNLQFFNHAEGYVEPVIASGSAAISSFNYVYQYKDHLGNIRLSYTDADGNGTIKQDEIIEENNYYPFGLKHKGYNNVVNGAESKYKYHGKEHQEELGLNWYDYGARNYQPDIGRWFNPDPLSDEFPEWSPYNFVKNNPSFYIDPTGLAPETIYEDINSGETVEVDDGIDKTIKVNSSNFQKAKSFANEINSNPDANGMTSIGVSRDVADGYNEFYNSVNSYDGFSLSNLYDYAFVQPELTVTGEVTGSAGALEYVSVGVGGFILKSLGNNLARNSSKILNFTSKQLQAKFKHAVDFGVKGSWNKGAGSKFSSVINQHINSSSVQIIQGTYRGNPAVHYLNSKSGLNVIANPNGTFVSGWKLNSKQLENVIKHGGL